MILQVPMYITLHLGQYNNNYTFRYYGVRIGIIGKNRVRLEWV